MPRIISLIASATEIVHALGLGRFQVGRSHECDFPPEVLPLPVCTRPSFPVSGSSAEIDALVKDKLRAAASLYDVFPETVEGLFPTHIITQTQCRVCAVSLDDVRRALARSVTTHPTVIALEPNDLAGIWSGILEIARSCGYAERGIALVESLRRDMAAIAATAASAPRPRLAVIEWHEPLMAAGNWTPQLIEMAGGINLFGAPGEHSPYLSWHELAAADPDVILTAPCGFDLSRTASEMHWLTSRPEWPRLRAVASGRVFLADGNQFFNRPGPRVTAALRALAEILHPDLFEPTLSPSVWRRWTGPPL